MADPQLESEWAMPAGIVGLLMASVVITVGTVWAFEHHAPDFNVFYAAWRLVLEGRGAAVYRESPDRFLYAPGFAWLLSPLALFPRSVALAFWCFAKAGIVGFIVREFQPKREGPVSIASLGMAAWGVVLVARPLLIDFQYGQVNTLILGVCCAALLSHFRSSEGDWKDGARWFALGVAAVAKIFPLPLLILPWVLCVSVPRSRLRWERIGVIAGVGLILAIPAVSLGANGTLQLLQEWRGALISRGLPFESHNQSFSAWVHRWFSGELVHIVSMGMEPVHMGWRLMANPTLGLLALAWISLTAGCLLAWLFYAWEARPDGQRRIGVLRWVAVSTALLILPSHLVWKPYFVMFLPVGALIMSAQTLTRTRAVLIWVAFTAMNVLGFDLLGADWGARAEAASSMLWAALIYLGLCWVDSSAVIPSSSFRKASRF